MSFDPSTSRRTAEPALFVPLILLVLIGLMLALHAFRVLALGLFEDADVRLLDWTAFVPARFSISVGLTSGDAVLAEIVASNPEMQGLRLLLFKAFVADGDAKPWTLLSYALLHANWEHVIFNCLWMLVFGSPVVQRFGGWRFLAFFMVTALCGAVFHALFNTTDVAVLVGASGAVSGLTAGVLRFGVGPQGFGAGREAWFKPAAPLLQALQNRQVLVFIAIWFGVNFLAGLGVPVGGSADLRIAWEAHVGGFLAGLLLFSWFDPIRENA